MNSVIIYGAKTLERYTNQILVQGFLNNFWEARKGPPSSLSTTKADAVLYQIHGSPHAKEEDAIILKMLAHALASNRKQRKIVVLLHRPDEIQVRYPALKNILLKAKKEIGLVFLGNKHISDEFFPVQHIRKKIIPHGFFDLKPEFQIDPIVIGSHTTWGEMRSIEHALKLLIEVFRLGSDRNIVGYLGGKPQKQLTINRLREVFKRFNFDNSIQLLDAHAYSIKQAIGKARSGINIILADSLDSQPKEIGVTYNIQLYYLGNKIRTGESSGSLHASTGIPVIFEMNGSEEIEDLQVIKVPYTSVNDIESVDFLAGVKKIINSIDDGSFLKMLKHNLTQSKKFNNTFIAKSYINLFHELA